MGNLGATEILLILLVVLLLFGARRIPEIARGLGKGIREFKDATNDIKRELTVDESRRPSLPLQGETYARTMTGEPVAFAAAAPGMPGAPAPMPATMTSAAVGGAAEAVPSYEKNLYPSAAVTGDPAHGIPSTGTVTAPIPPAAANDAPPPRTGGL